MFLTFQGKDHLNVHLKVVQGHLPHPISVKYISEHTQENDHTFVRRKDVAEPLLVLLTIKII